MLDVVLYRLALEPPPHTLLLWQNSALPARLGLNPKWGGGGLGPDPLRNGEDPLPIDENKISHHCPGHNLPFR